MRAITALLALSCAGTALGTFDLPPRARGGKIAKKLGVGVLQSGSSEAQFWQAKIDNFNSADNRTYAQRYFVDDQHYDPENGPVFLYIAGEWTINGPPTGYLQELGKKYSALLISLEHRFYGVSIPNNDMSTKNLRFLTVEQALADTAAFIDYYNAEKGTQGKRWFTFGGSYPGGLSAWFKILYPNHSVGSLSSSGVVNPILDFVEFDQRVSAALGNKCADQIRRTQRAFEYMHEQPNGLAKSLQMFNCDSKMSVTDFYFMIADSWSMADQYGSKKDLCDTMLAVGEDASPEVLTETFAAFTMDYWGDDFCGCFYDTNCLKDHTTAEVDSRSWRWQTCYEVAWFNTAPKVGSLRSTTLDVEYHLKQCAEVFGIPMFPRVEYMRKLFGGAMPQAHNVFYSDFSDDPWLEASVHYPLAEDQPFFLATCDGCFHCMDMKQPKESDPEALKQSRVEFEGYLTKWLAGN